MSTFRKTYAAQAAEQTITAAAFLALATILTLPTIGGVASMAAFVVTAWSLGVTLGRWAADQKTVERRERAASQARHPSRARQWLVPPTVEDHYSGPRKIVKSGDGEAIVATHNGRDYEVHNHGPHEGRGLECPEYTTKGGRLRGACIVQAEIARAYGMEAGR